MVLSFGLSTYAIMHWAVGTVVVVLVKQYSLIDLKEEFHDDSQYNRKRKDDDLGYSSVKI